MYRLLQLAVLAMGLALTSCQVIANIESHPADPLPTGCTLPQPGAGDGKIRFANWLASNAKVDLCVRPTGSSSYGRPVLRSSGAGKDSICGGGLAYGQETTPFKTTAGNLDFKVIAAGQTCAAVALAEKTNVEITANFVRTIAFLGGKDVTSLVNVYIETPASTNESQNRRIRLVNAVPGYSIQFGVGAAKKLPTTITETVFNVKGMEFGHLVDSKEKGFPLFNYDEFGYLSAPSQAVNVVAVQRGQSKALLQLVYEGAGTYSLIAVGDPAGGVPVRALLCRDIDPGRPDETAACSFSDLENFSIDVFNAALYGPRAPVESARVNQVMARLAARGATSDLLCVSELARHRDPEMPEEQQGWTQEALIDAAGAYPEGYRYFHSATTNLDTVFSDPPNQVGEIPPEAGRAPCDPDADPVRIDNAYKCLVENCSSKGMSDQGVSQGGATCYSSNCSSPLSFLLYGEEPQRQCYLCLLLNALSYKTWARNREICTTDTRRPYAFNGASSSLLLSKFPLEDKDQFVLSATAFRRTAAYARMEYDVGKSIDVYCVHSPPLLGGQVAYTGGYANGASTTTGAAWYEEQTWAIKRLIEWIKKKSGDRPAIIMGDWSASKKAYDSNGVVINGTDGLPIVADVNPATIEALQGAFLEAYPTPAKELPQYTPQCTRCPEKREMGGLANIYNEGFDPQWSLRVYMKSPWFDNPATDSTLFYTESDVEINDAKFGLFGPLSDTYGYNVRLRRPSE